MLRDPRIVLGHLTAWLGRLMMEADTVVAPRDRKPREGER
jgi:hypothetical protein